MSPIKPSWQAAFASSLTPASLSVPPSAGPQIPAFPGLPGLPPPPPQTPAIEPTGPTEKSQDGLSSSVPPQRGLVRPAAARSRRRLLPAGTVLNAILLTAVSTQMPGDAVAHVTSDVHGRDGSVLLPRGSRLVGSYKNRVALGDNRVAIAWDRLEIDGRSYELPGLASTSPDGAAGLPGDVNNHTGLVFGRAALLSLIGAGAQLGQPSESRLGATLSNREQVSGSVSQQLSQAANEYLNRAVNVAPTLTIPAGARVTVLLPFDLELADRSLAAPAIPGDLRP
jgi:type IV secretory pathway VirB10-like protein